MGLNKLNTIAALLGNDKEIIVRWDARSGTWFIHCFEDATGKTIYQTYTNTIEAKLDKLIEKLGGKQDDKE